LTDKLTIGTRGSKLALWQTNWVRDQLAELFPSITIDIRIISTKGDRVLDVALPTLGEQGKGLFTRELEDALFDREVDLAVHSLKDLPTDLPSGLHISAICRREDVRDALITRAPGQTFGGLAGGAVIGTSSLRRQAQLKAVRADIVTRPVRGNVDTRLRKLAEGQYDALVLASAGLHRLGYADRIGQYLDTDLMLPAVGQGALALESRSEDPRVNELLSRLEHRETRIACEAERACLRGLGGGCLVPIAAYAEINGSRLTVRGLVASPNGATIIRAVRIGEAAAASETGFALAEELLSRGARTLLVEEG